MRYTVTGLVDPDTTTLHIAAVLAGEQPHLDPDPDPGDAVGLQRWQVFLDADNPGHAELRAHQVFDYGAVPEVVPAADLKPGDAVIDMVGEHGPDIQYVHAAPTVHGGQVDVTWVDDSRPTSMPAGTKVLTIAANARRPAGLRD